MYAIVRAGGRQEKVAVGDVLVVDKVEGAPGDAVKLVPLLLVDGTDVTSAADALAKVSVAAEIVEATKARRSSSRSSRTRPGTRSGRVTVSR